MLQKTNTISGKTFQPNDLSDEVAIASRTARKIASRKYQDNNHIWAGYTYLAQLVVHDLTHLRTNGSGGLHNPGDSKLNLSTIFGSGPGVGSDFIAVDGSSFAWHQKPQQNGAWIQPTAIPTYVNDGEKAKFILADRRNDDNVILLQLRNFFCLLYEQKWKELRDYEKARDAVAASFRAVVRKDLCDRLLTKKIAHMVREEPKVLLGLANDILVAENGQSYREFIFAVGRIGHAMTRSNYLISDAQEGTGDTSVVQLIKAGKANKFPDNEPLWRANWCRLFHRKGVNKPVLRSRRISPLLDRIFGTLETDSSLQSNGEDIFSNKVMTIDLFRTFDGIKSGQFIARYLKKRLNSKIKILEGDQLIQKALGDDKDVCQAVERFNAWFAKQPTWRQETPLLLYVLIEANNICGGRHLGPVGSFVFGAAIAKGLEAESCDPSIQSMPELLDSYFKTNAHTVMLARKQSQTKSSIKERN